MQPKLTSSKWTQAAALLLIGGALAWAIKLSVIFSTNGRVIDTGAAALFMKVGLVLFLVGSTAIGSRLSYQRKTSVRVMAIILSPVLVFGSFLLFGMITASLFQKSSVWYAQQEAPIAMAVIIYLAAGLLLYRNAKPVATIFHQQGS